MLTAFLCLVVLMGIFTVGRYYSKRIFCPLCLAVATSWIVGLMLYLNGRWNDVLILAILMGSSLGALVTMFGKRWGMTMKSIVYLAGLPTIYFLLQKDIAKAAVGFTTTILFIVLANVFQKKPENEHDEFDSCCS